MLTHLLKRPKEVGDVHSVQVTCDIFLTLPATLPLGPSLALST